MNILDIIILICFIPAVIQGLRKGFIAQAISLVSIIAGVWASARFAEVTSQFLAQYITVSEQAMKVISFAVILTAVFLILGLIGRMLEGLFNLVMLGWLNRLLGVAFSAIKCLLVLGLLVVVFNSINATFGFVKPEALADSVLYPVVKDTADTIFPYLKTIFTLKS
jgi:membrane protein required for colicin V production